ncbi:arylesterase [Celerinatantimonas sp. MCCC 1A17872]|uniref:arylesterase n=1 Tax=Celerinatantimonas sp. MCCC 1A17872 TaxID=3177514 RepID=UPI0038C65B6F
MVKIVVWFISCTLMLWNIQAYAATTTLLILGDSLSAGHRMNTSQSWPTLLQEKLPNVQIINASSSGETSSGGARRLPALLVKYHPNWCLLELGGNDGLQGLPPKFLKTQLTNMIQQSMQAQCRVILSEIKIPPNYGKRYSESFNQVYHQLAQQFKLPLMPFFVEPIYQEKEMMQADGIHPSVKAQPIIASEVAKFLKPILGKNK